MTNEHCKSGVLQGLSTCMKPLLLYLTVMKHLSDLEIAHKCTKSTFTIPEIFKFVLSVVFTSPIWL